MGQCPPFRTAHPKPPVCFPEEFRAPKAYERYRTDGIDLCVEADVQPTPPALNYRLTRLHLVADLSQDIG
jgi:hypothetical protein